MKNLLVFCIFILVYGCNITNNKVYNVSGNIIELSIVTAKLKTSDSTYISPIKNGVFTFTIPAAAEEYINLEIGKEILLFARPKDDIFIRCSGSGIIDFSGTGYHESQYLYEKQILVKELGFDDPRNIDIDLYSSEPIIFKTRIDSIKQIRINHLNNFKIQNPDLSDKFFKIENKLIHYFWVNQMFKYPEFYQMLTLRTPQLPERYYEFTNEIEPNEEELFQFNEYKVALSSYLNFKSREIKNKYLLAKELISNKELFEELMFIEFNQYISFNGIDSIESSCLEFLNSLSDKNKKEILMSKYESWLNLGKGKKAPDFKIKDNEGDFVSLSDFLGKYVYIDCWSSYCGPCIAEMPDMKKLAEEFEGRNFVFISISTDSDKKRWLNKISEYNMNTINLCTEGTKHQFNNDYNAKALPRYILIDDKGIIIDATANKPSLMKRELEQYATF